MATAPRRLARVAGVLVGLILIALGALHLPPVRAFVLERVRAYAERELGLALRASSVSYNLLTRTIELRDLSIASASASDPFLQTDRALVGFGLGIFAGRPTLNRIVLTQPRLTIVRYADGTVNLPASREGPPQTTPLQLGVVSVTALSARLDDRVAGRSFTLGPFDLSVDTTDASPKPGAFGPGPFSFRAGEITASGTLAGRLAFDGARLRIESLRAETSEGRVELTGWADAIGERPAVSAHVSATVDLQQAARLARVDARGLAGRLEAALDVSGAVAAPVIAMTVTSRDLDYAPIGGVRLNARSSFSGNHAVIDALDIESHAGSLHIHGDIDLDDTPTRTARTPSRLALRWSDLRIDDLAQAFGFAAPVRSGSVANGSATADFDARDRDARLWSHLRVDATTALHPAVDAPSSDTLALSGGADLVLDQRRWSLRHSIQSRRAGADLAGEVNGLVSDEPGLQSTLSGRSRFRVADIGAVMPLIQTAGASVPAAVAEGLAGSIGATADLAGTIATPRARVDLAVRDLRARQLPRAGAVDAQLAIDANGVQALQVQATSGTTSLHASGRYSWRGLFDGRVELSQGDLSELARQLELPVAVSGSARLESTISGDSRAGQAEVSLSARDLVVDEVSVGPVDATGKVALVDGGLTTIDATAPSLGARARFEIVNREAYPVSGDITIDRDDIGALIPSRYRNQIGDLSGRLSATARGSGFLSDPAGIRGRIDLAALDVTSRTTHLTLTAPGSVTIGQDSIAFDSVALGIGQRTRATIAGRLGLTAVPQPLRLHLEGPLSELIDSGAVIADMAPVPLRADGTAILDLAVSGTLDHPLPNGSLVVRSPSLTYGSLSPMTGLDLEAAIDPAGIALRTLTAEWQGASLRADGVLPWRVVLSEVQLSPGSSLARWVSALPPEPARASVTVRADNISDAVLKDFVAPERLQQIQGGAFVTVALDADRLSLERIAGTAVLDRAWVTLAGVPFYQSVPTRLRIQNGRASIDAFQWSAEGNSISASGGASLIASRPSIDLGVKGALDLRVLGAFVSGVAAGGTADADLTVSGSVDAPEIGGRITLTGGELQVDSPRVSTSDLNGTIRLADRKATVSLSGLVNAGNATLEGTLDLEDVSAPRGNLQLTARGVALEYPPGLQIESNVSAELALGTRSTLTGRVDVLGGTYREPIVISRQLLNLRSTTGVARTPSPDDWLSRLQLDVAVATASDLHIDNNYGRLDVGATLRIVGTATDPGVVGRLQAADDGEIYLGGNTYRIERLAIDLANPRVITPEVNFAAQTRIGDLPIGVELRCPAAAPCERKVTSLATNVDDKEAESRLFGAGAAGGSAGEGLVRLLSGELLGVVSRTVGLDTVRLEQGAQRRDIFDDPTLVSGDVNPASRLTLAKRLGSNVELVYSQNLADNGFTWITSYAGPYGLSGRVLVLDDQSRSYEFRHEPPIGAARTRRRSRPVAPRIASITIQGTPGFPESEVRKQLHQDTGSRWTFAAWQQDRDRLARFYRERSFFEARIRARRLPVDRVGSAAPDAAGNATVDQVQLEYAITRGPTTHLVVRGATLPDTVRDRIVGRWASALFDGFLENDARAIVREHFYREGHLQATVNATVGVDASRETKTLTIDVVPGPLVPGRIDVRGNSALPTDQLLSVVNSAETVAAWLDPRSVERLLENHYRSEGFLVADVSVGVPAISNGTSVVTIDVVEGAAYSIAAIDLSGLSDVPEQEARDAVALSSGQRYRPADVSKAADRLETLLRQSSYLAARVDVETTIDASAARVGVALRVTPGRRSILRDVVVTGGDATKPQIARAIVLEPNAPLDPAAIGETRQRLYDLDVYRSVDIAIEPVASAAPPASADGPVEQPVAATIALEERPRYRLRYGLAVSDEVEGSGERDQRLGVAADLENRNIFGRGATAGFSARLRRDQQVGRATLGANRLFGFPVRSTIFAERKREQSNTEGAFPITSDITSLTAEQAYRVGRAIQWRYGYGIERNHTFIRSNDTDPFDLTVKIARFTTSGLVDRRDDAFNPRRGWFGSSALELSNSGLGSDLSFLKDFSQYSHFVPVGRGAVLAAAARLGLARTFDEQELIPSERFYAGGANSVRGYREDDLGARSVLGDAEGGSALLVLNGELRFPVYRWLKGVGFVDLGNVYPDVSDISFTKLQIGMGAGARFDTPFGLIRFDLGVPVNRRSFDPRWRLHIGFGQAF